MKALAIYALEVLACSGVLLGAYAILLDRRVRFRWCRAYLLASTLVAALIPLLRIPVWPGKVIEVAPTVALPAEEWTAEVIEEAAPVVTPEILCLAGYLVGVSLIAGVMLWQVVRIRRLRRGAAITRTDRFTLVRTPQRIASFSFFRSIYIWDQTPAAELQAIVAHEASHIAHRHSAERVAMECMKAALWWNPFVWLTARRLTEAEEFEADSDVLASGYDIEHYMKTIFRQLFGYSPEIANGLRDSLTKKRFKMMTTKTPGRHSLLRLAGTLPAVIGLLCAFSFTTRAAEIRIAETEKTPADNVATASDETKKEVSVTVIKDGKPLSGAIVLITGTNAGTVTDTNGTARISAAPGSELAISYVGCKTEKIRVSDTPGGEAHALTLTSTDNQLDAISITPGAKKADKKAAAGKAVLKITLANTTEPAVGATVVIAGTKTGVVADAKGEASIEAPEGAVLEVGYPDYLSASVVVGKQSDYVVRLVPENSKTGKHPASGDNATPKPLFVVDGVEQASIDNLDPRSIESVSVLKNQSATALYGPRGKNGVVVVTTKGAAKPVTEEAAFDEKTGAIKKTAVNYDEVEPFIIAEKMPSFQGGDLNTFRTWVQERIQYPAEAAKQNIQGRVVVSFEIKADGSLADLKVLQSPDKLLSDEACRVIESSPKWTPGEQRGQKVTVKYTLPVDFRTAAAKQATAQTAPAGDEPFLITEVMPSFQGGDLSAFRQWVQMHVRYPAEAMKQNIQGRVVTSFIVEKDGSVSNINVLQSPGKLLSDEASRVIGNVPADAWAPGRQRGQAVRVKLTVPVDFRLQGSGKAPGQAEKVSGSVDEIVVVGYSTPKK
ncbi:TonB family protein [Alistipes sp. kh20]|uniref:M56 family metallopeptidase n=1 Tax=Alistipes montrealensis TaxID=2834113 RepID=UPI001BCD429F|nr:M56 family metallopeptidase [Alistipes montrealensis]MBS4766584.1 TonB family protein [Alistipes montrealensis]